MIWTAWNNGKKHSSGAGYGFKISAADRDLSFMRNWSKVTLELPRASGATFIEVNIDKSSFWTDCRELIADAIGRWLLDQGFAPWPSGQPPKFEVEPVGAGRFRVNGLATTR